MPFQSQAQRAFMFSQHPEIAKRWAKEYPNQGKLPMHKKKKKPSKKNYSMEVIKSPCDRDWET